MQSQLSELGIGAHTLDLLDVIQDVIELLGEGGQRLSGRLEGQITQHVHEASQASLGDVETTLQLLKEFLSGLAYLGGEFRPLLVQRQQLCDGLLLHVTLDRE